MRRLMTRTFLAVAAAGGAFLAMGATGVASATPTPYAPIPTHNQAGYAATQNTFRYVITTVKVPAVNTHASTYAEVVLGGPNVTPATLGVKAGGGANSVAWNAVGGLGGMAGGTMSMAPKVGDMLTLSIYYNTKTKSDNFVVTDVTQKVTETKVVPAPAHVVYKGAEVACVLYGKVTAPKYANKLWSFTGTHVTTLAGTRGTMVGPWLIRKVIAVAPDGHVVMGPSALWDSGKAFSAWLKPAK